MVVRSEVGNGLWNRDSYIAMERTVMKIWDPVSKHHRIRNATE